jgi:hypothetical protein
MLKTARIFSFAAMSLASLALPHMAHGAQPKCVQQTGKIVTRCDVHNIDDESLKADYFAERAHFTPGSNKPTIGLALSGGGTKAGMFSHGVLHGLHDANVLKHVDAISSVSGGGYAAYWYFSKLLESSRDPSFNINQIFDDCLPYYWVQFGTDEHNKAAMDAAVRRPPTPNMGICDNASHFRVKGTSGVDDPFRWQAHLVRWPDVFQREPTYLDGGWQNRPEGPIRDGIAKAILIEPLGGKSEIPLLYQHGIERTWGLNPLPRDPLLVANNKKHKAGERINWRYSNADWSAPSVLGVPMPHVDEKTTQWSQLRKLYDANTDGRTLPLWIVNTNDGDKGEDNTSKIFEITPFGYGTSNPRFPGYRNVTPDRTLSFSNLSTSVRAAAGFADAQGLEHAQLRTFIKRVAKIFPGAEWGIDTNVVTADGQYHKVHLSDGGGADNLGLYSLLKRGLDDIIIVDTAADGAGAMDDLCAIKRALGTDLKLEFPALNKFEDVCGEKSKLVYNVSAWKNPVVKGTAKWMGPDHKERRVSNLWLIKAAWDERAVAAAFTHPETCGSAPGQINCLLAVFYGHNTMVRGGKDQFMLFPQLSTVQTTANSSSYLFWGFRELGRMVGSNLKVNSAGRIELRVEEQCKQVALPTSKKGHNRPEVNRFKAPTSCDTTL